MSSLLKDNLFIVQGVGSLLRGEILYLQYLPKKKGGGELVPAISNIHTRYQAE